MTFPGKPKTLEEAWEIIVALVLRINELEGRLEKNSRNSSKPPGSDGLRKPPRPQSLRPPSDRKPGGQEGHSGTTLEMVATPDQVIRHPVSRCRQCRHSLKTIPAQEERRQVFDVPPLRFFVTEHQGEVKICPRCGMENHSEFPEEAVGAASYGPHFQTLSLYFMNEQLIPYKRCAVLFRDLFSLPVSPGTLFGVQKRCAKTWTVHPARYRKESPGRPWLTLMKAD